MNEDVGLDEEGRMEKKIVSCRFKENKL